MATAAPPAVAPARDATRPAVLGGGRARWALFALWGVYLVLPILATLLYSLATVWRNTALPDGLTLTWWSETLSDGRLLDALRRSFVLAILTVIVIAVLTLPPLYWSYVRNPRLRVVMQLAALLPFALPFVVLAYGMKRLAGLTAFTTPFEASNELLLIGHVALAFPFFLWPVDAAMASLGVGRLQEAAAASGAGPVTTLVRVVLPGIRGGLTTGAALAFATSFGEYSIARVITGNSFETLPVWQVAQLQDTAGNPNGVAVMAIFTLGVLFAMTVVAARQDRGDSAGALLPGLGGKKERT